MTLSAGLAAVLVACGGGGGDDDEQAADDAEPTTTADQSEAAVLPEGCPVDTPFTVRFDEGGDALPGIEGSTFEVAHAGARPFPIVPDPDGQLSPREVTERGQETDLLGYTLYLTDFAFDADDIGTLGMTPPDGGTHLALSVVPPTLDGIAEGDTVVGGRPDYETTTTFGTVGTLYQTAIVPEPPFLSTTSEELGRAEILHLDDDWLCMRWIQAGQVNAPPGESAPYALDVVVAGPLLPRAPVPFT